MMKERGLEENIQIYYPNSILCTDNAAMIGSAAYFNYMGGIESKLDFKVMPNLGLE